MRDLSHPYTLYGLEPPPAPNLDALRAAARAIREARPGLTMDVLAARSGLSRNAVLNLLNGARDGSVTSWHKLAHGLDVPFYELVQHLDDPEPPGQGVAAATRAESHRSAASDHPLTSAGSQ